MKVKRRKSIGTLFAEGKPIDAAMRKAAREAVRKHRLAGLPVVVWRDGRIVHVLPERIKTMKRTVGRTASGSSPDNLRPT